MPTSTFNSHPPTALIPSLRPVGFWRAFDSLSTGKALMVVWRSLFGSDFPHIQPFLQPTTEHSLTYPCTRMPWCDCHHEVTEDAEWEQVAVCTCGDCEPFPLTRQDTTLHTFNRRAFGEALRHALGFAPPLTRSALCTLHSALLEVGSYPPLHAPIYFYAPTSAAALSAQVHAMLAGSAGPILLLTPTPTWMTSPILRTLAAGGCAHLALSTFLAPSAVHPPRRAGSPRTAGSLTFSSISPSAPTLFVNSVAFCEQFLARWSSRIPGATGSTALLENLHREIAAVRHDFVELRTAKQRLEKMQADGVFAFTQKVDPTSFKILCAILAHGDAAKAARTLGIGDPMMRKLLRQWRTRGPAYQAMLDLVRWRKTVGRKETVPLNDAILHDKPDTTDYPALLSDLLDGLLSMTDTNWQDLAEELAQLLRPALSGTQHPRTAHPTPVRKTL